MDLPARPALLPAAALLLGISLGFRLVAPALPLLLALAALGAAFGRRPGWLLALFAAGLALPAIRGEAAGGGGPPRPGAPVEVVAEVAGHWRRFEDSWSAPLEVVRLRQGRWVGAHPRDVQLTLPGEDPPPPFGSRLRLQGYLRRSPGFANRIPAPPGPWRLAVKSRRLMQVQRGPQGASGRLAAGLRRRVERAYAEAGGEAPGVRLARALVLGDPTAVPGGWKRGLRRTGLSHLLAVSGLHVGLLGGLVLLLAGGLPRIPRLGLALAAVGLYLLLVGPRASLLRASVMALAAVAALALERPPAAANALGWAAALLAAGRPALVADLGFQLTLGATAGIVLLAPPLARRWGPPLPAWLATPLAATVAAQLGTLPWALPSFYLLPLAAPLYNLVAVPWTAAVLAVALGWTAAALLSPDFARLLTPLLDAAAAPFGWPAAMRPSVGLTLPLALPAWSAGLLAAALAAMAWRPRRFRLAGLACLLVTQTGAPGRPPGVEAAVFDVGQGDAILLRDGRRALLVDGGGWEWGDLGGRVLLPALLAEGVRRLDALVLTHPDRDHCGGLADLAGYLPVAEVWTATGWPPTPCMVTLATVAGARLRVVGAGDRLRLGRWRLAVLHPAAGDAGAANDRSLVLAAEAFGRRLLLTGDISAASERKLLARTPAALACDLLKVAHHGSKSSTTPAFLAAARPGLAAISAGRNNPYHHPAALVLERLRARRIPTLRTDRHGMIHLAIDPGGRLRIAFPGPAGSPWWE